MKYLISACLANQAVRYDGKAYHFSQIQNFLAEHQVILACPEVLGGLPIPRAAAEIQAGSATQVLNGTARIIDTQGQDVSHAFIQGAYATLALAQTHQVDLVVLKENSPSCGSHFIYDGSFSGRKIHAAGITTTLLTAHGFKVISEHEFLQQLEQQSHAS